MKKDCVRKPTRNNGRNPGAPRGSVSLRSAVQRRGRAAGLAASMARPGFAQAWIRETTKTDLELSALGALDLDRRVFRVGAAVFPFADPAPADVFTLESPFE